MKALKTIFAEEQAKFDKTEAKRKRRAMKTPPKASLHQLADMHQRIYKVADFLEEVAQDFQKKGYQLEFMSGAMVEQKKPDHKGKSNFLHLHHVFAQKADGNRGRHVLTIEVRSELDPHNKKKPVVDIFCSKAGRQVKTRVYDRHNGKMRLKAKDMMRREIVRSLVRGPK